MHPAGKSQKGRNERTGLHCSPHSIYSITICDVIVILKQHAQDAHIPTKTGQNSVKKYLKQDNSDHYKSN